MPSHLPEAEPILPGHTLIRPALGMLKSSVKFPHKDQENGAGVLGNLNNLGIRYDGRNERILYSGFRRTPAKYIVDKNKNVLDQLLRNIKKLTKTRSKRDKRIVKIFPKNRYRLHGPFAYKNLGNVSPKRNSGKRHKPYLRQDDDDDDNEYNDGDAEDDDDVSWSDEYGQEYEENNDYIEPEHTDNDNSKKKWFWDSQNSFNHIKINQEAPEYSDLIPVNVSKDIRSWWFYHQDDYQPFEAKTDE
ncbi:uncharacterized protein PF07_0086-like [Ostrinia furnacalis]|uniref:uncharacterized protein PF07_0086-like n=1 Tax=Ostrinia furnacalis TaxID=93504 RepID=UPI0010401565|nr:uncharacterized protein PF07_0086-like [Ostrinia furnacalis]